MDDLATIELFERVREHIASQDVSIRHVIEASRNRSYRDQPDTFFIRQLIATVLGWNLEDPRHLRQIEQMVHEAEQSATLAEQACERQGAQVFPGGDAVASSDVEASLSYGARRDSDSSLSTLSRAESGRNLKQGSGSIALSSCLKTFYQSRQTAFPRSIAEELRAASNLPQALRTVRQLFPILNRRRAYQYLVDCGYPAAVPSAPLARLAHRLSVVKTENSPIARELELLAWLERISRLTHVGISEVEHYLSLFTGARSADGVSSICTTRPVCGSCCISDHCHYFRFKGRDTERESRPIKNWSVDERPREKLLDGHRLSNAELLAIIIRTGSGSQSALDLSRAILDRFETLHRLEHAAPDEIAQIRGIGLAKAAEIKAAIELGRRVVSTTADDRDALKQIESSKSIFDLYRTRYKTATQEEFLLLALNTKNRIVREISVSVGTLNSSIVHPRDVFKHALREAAAAVIFVHNHPSGDPSPSAEDRSLTRRLVEAGNLLGIRVLDHIIIGSQRYYSFSDEGELS